MLRLMGLLLTAGLGSATLVASGTVEDVAHRLSEAVQTLMDTPSAALAGGGPVGAAFIAPVALLLIALLAFRLVRLLGLLLTLSGAALIVLAVLFVMHANPGIGALLPDLLPT